MLRAQTSGVQINRLDDDSRIKTMGLTATAGLDLLYDDNVYRVDDRVEDPTDDLIVTPWVELAYGKPIGRHRIGHRLSFSNGSSTSSAPGKG